MSTRTAHEADARPQPEHAPAPIRAVYRLRARPEEAERLAEKIAYEQTVELPKALVTDEHVRERVVARVDAVDPDPASGEHFLARLAYPQHLASGQLPQLVNLLYGNISILPDIRLVDVSLPDSLLGRFEGPLHGIEGLRRLTGVRDRPLLATALKPRGLSAERLAAMAGAFARGGGDIVKDDQNLVDADFESFKHRVQACHRAVEAANEATGRRCLYFPHLAAPAGELERYAEFLHWLGVPGVLACPMIMGLDTAREITRRHRFVYMAHPALTGSYTGSFDQGMDHGVLLGTLFRLGGADISVFPNFGGRFSFTRDQCRSIRRRLRGQLGRLRPALPCPAGGMRFQNLADMCADYGSDAVFLIGGSLLGHSDDLAGSTRTFLDAIREHFDERLVAPEEPDVPEPPDTAKQVLEHLAFREGFEWQGREIQPYKIGGSLPFKGSRRVELVGQHGERTSFDLRYFEIAPGGYTSLEKHLHTHVIIGARGTGKLASGDREITVNPMDVAYVPPLKTHQLRNEAGEPFGFFCIVDHERDRPMEP